MWSNHLILCHPLLLHWIFPSIRVFSKESAFHIRWPKYWRFSFSFSPSNKYSGLISFRIDWFDLLAVQGTLRSILQHHNLKALILLHPAFFMVQLSHQYMTTGKTVTMNIPTFVGKVMSLLLHMLFRFVIAFLPRRKRLLNFMAAVTVRSDFGAQNLSNPTVDNMKLNYRETRFRCISLTNRQPQRWRFLLRFLNWPCHLSNE